MIMYYVSVTAFWRLVSLEIVMRLLTSVLYHDASYAAFFLCVLLVGGWVSAMIISYVIVTAFWHLEILETVIFSVIYIFVDDSP